jgi:hypothetical protein
VTSCGQLTQAQTGASGQSFLAESGLSDCQAAQRVVASGLSRLLPSSPIMRCAPHPRASVCRGVSVLVRVSVGTVLSAGQTGTLGRGRRLSAGFSLPLVVIRIDSTEGDRDLLASATADARLLPDEVPTPVPQLLQPLKRRPLKKKSGCGAEANNNIKVTHAARRQLGLQALSRRAAPGPAHRQRIHR